VIIDKIENASLYAGLGKRIAAGLRYLQETDFSAVENGRHEIDGDDIYVLVMEYEPKPITEACWEAHRKYIDIQFVVTGVERIGVIDISELEAVEPYDAETDFLKLSGSGALFDFHAGVFILLYPHDAHMPGLAPDKKQSVRKVVVKVRAD